MVRQLEELVSSSLDWDHIFRLALFHRVSPLLFQNIQAVASGAVPSSVIEKMRKSTHWSALNNLTILKELDRLLRLFEEHAIPVISFKGLVLGETIYGNLALRPCDDLDILVPLNRIAEVEQILIGAGYEAAGKMRGLNKLRKSYMLFLAQQYPFVRRSPLVGVDVHTNIMPPGYYYPLRFDELNSRAHDVKVGGVSVKSFEPEDLLQILCYHGVKNRWEKLKHVCDVAELINTYDELKWDVVLNRAHSMRGERVLFIGLYLAKTLLSIQLPDHVQAKVQADMQVAHWADLIMKRLPEQLSLGMASYGERFSFHLATQDTVGTKIRYCLYSLLRRF